LTLCFCVLLYVYVSKKGGGRMRLWLALILTAALVAAPAPAVAAGVPFSDLSGHWARQAVEAGVASGFIAGYPDGTFRPNASVTRAEFFKMLGGAMRLPAAKGQTGLSEEQAVPLHWSFDRGYVQAAVNGGLLYPPDYAGGQFGPDVQITRREIVVAAVRALGKEALAQSQELSLDVPDGAAYAQWLKNYAAIALGEGIITGYEDRSLGLDRTATRAEALVMIQRIMAKVTANLQPYTGPTGVNVLRHPAEGEPYWTVSAAASVSDGTATYALPEGAGDVKLLPAPGKAAWVSFSAGGSGVVGRLARGQFSEAVRHEAHTPALLAVDDDGYLWFTDGESRLQLAAPDGKVKSIDSVTEPIHFGDVDWNGAFWALGSAKVYRIGIEGDVMPYDFEVGSLHDVVHMTLNEDGSLWLMTTSAGAPGAAKAEALQVQFGKVTAKVRVLGPYAGGLDGGARLVVSGRSGPFLWLSAHVTEPGAAERFEGLYRFNLLTGEAARMVVPAAVADGYTVVAAPDGGALLKDVAGLFWRVLP